MRSISSTKSTTETSTETPAESSTEAPTETTRESGNVVTGDQFPGRLFVQ